ncbi:MAG TPA: hypothetical protein VFZ58_05585 [Candidatus Saccharimonadales bacterium]
MAEQTEPKRSEHSAQQANNEAHSHWTVLSADSSVAEVTPQGHLNIPGINDRTAGSTQVAANLIAMAPGAKAKGHVHLRHESVILVLYGHAVTFMGPKQTPTFQGPGDWLFIGMGVEHLPANLSEEEPVIATVFRADPKFIESLELRPYIDAIAENLLPALRAQHAAGTLSGSGQEYELSIAPLLERYRDTILNLQQ